MKRLLYLSFFFLFAGGALTLGCAKKTPPLKWQEFDSEDGGFSVTLPVGPTEKATRVIETGAGPVGIYSTSVEVNEVTFEAAWHDLINLDTTRITPADVDRLMKSEVDGSIKALAGGQVVYRKPVSYEGFRGEEFQVRGKVSGTEFEITTRVFLLGVRFYELIVDCEPGKVSSGDVKKFMDSFQVLM